MRLSLMAIQPRSLCCAEPFNSTAAVATNMNHSGLHSRLNPALRMLRYGRNNVDAIALTLLAIPGEAARRCGMISPTVPR
jgi:hypothetical protein